MGDWADLVEAMEVAESGAPASAPQATAEEVAETVKEQVSAAPFDARELRELLSAAEARADEASRQRMELQREHDALKASYERLASLVREERDVEARAFVEQPLSLAVAESAAVEPDRVATSPSAVASCQLPCSLVASASEELEAATPAGAVRERGQGACQTNHSDAVQQARLALAARRQALQPFWTPAGDAEVATEFAADGELPSHGWQQYHVVQVPVPQPEFRPPLPDAHGQEAAGSWIADPSWMWTGAQASPELPDGVIDGTIATPPPWEDDLALLEDSCSAELAASQTGALMTAMPWADSFSSAGGCEFDDSARWTAVAGACDFENESTSAGSSSQVAPMDCIKPCAASSSTCGVHDFENDSTSADSSGRVQTRSMDTVPVRGTFIHYKLNAFDEEPGGVDPRVRTLARTNSGPSVMMKDVFQIKCPKEFPSLGAGTSPSETAKKVANSKKSTANAAKARRLGDSGKRAAPKWRVKDCHDLSQVARREDAVKAISAK